MAHVWVRLGGEFAICGRHAFRRERLGRDVLCCPMNIRDPLQVARLY